MSERVRLGREMKSFGAPATPLWLGEIWQHSPHQPATEAAVAMQGSSTELGTLAEGLHFNEWLRSSEMLKPLHEKLDAILALLQRHFARGSARCARSSGGRRRRRARQ